MPYVMVPVPEEHVQEVMQYMLRLVASEAMEDWTDENLEEFFLGLDESTRSLLSVVARGTNAGKEITIEAAADFLQVSGREVHGILRELTDSTRGMMRRALIVPALTNEELPNGRVRQKNVLTMVPNLARMIRAAERTERLSEPHSLEHEIG